MRPFLPILPFLAKYPFLKVSALFLEQEYGGVEEIIKSDDRITSEGRRLGIEIVESVLKGKDLDLDEVKGIRERFLCDVCDVKECRLKGEGYEYLKYCDYPDRRENYYSYLNLAKKYTVAYIVSKMAISKLTEASRKRFAIRMARVYREMLEKEDVGFLKFLAGDLGIRVRVESETFKVHFLDYLKAAVRIRDDRWKLVNRYVREGYVWLRKREFVRVAEEYIRDRIGERVDVNVDIGWSFREERSPDLKDIGIDVSCYPPCIKRIISDLRSGLNVPHSARFALAAFMLNIGMKVDDVVEVFRTAPDFDEEKTRYQVEHIAGMRGKREEYTCPSCSTMRSYGNCFKDSTCEGVNHPVLYYKRCVRRKRRKESSPQK